jgi:hypothetical protein
VSPKTLRGKPTWVRAWVCRARSKTPDAWFIRVDRAATANPNPIVMKVPVLTSWPKTF